MVADYWPEYMPRKVEYNYGEKPIYQYLREHATRKPDKPAVIFYGKEITWKELDDTSNRFANFLLKQGVRKGDRVGLYLPNCPQYYVVYMGANKVGASIVPLNSSYREYELEHVLTDVEMETLVTMDNLYPYVKKIESKTTLKNVVVSSIYDYFPDEPAIVVKEMPEAISTVYDGCFAYKEIMENYPSTPVNVPVDLEDIYNISFTSGTTGLPKGAMLTHRAGLYKSAARYMIYFSDNPCQEYHKVLIDTPIQHIAGMVRLNTALYGGMTAIILLRFDIEEILQCIEKYQVTHWSTSTVGMERVLEYKDIDKRNLSSLEDVKVNSYGITASKEMSDRFEALAGVSLSEGAYGLTEDHTGSSFVPKEKIKYGHICTGVPIPETKIKIIDVETGDVLPRNTIGEICVKSIAVFKGYWKNQEATDEVLKDGWLHTGDWGKLDDDGYLWFTGRIKDTLKSYGFTVIPEEVESILAHHPVVNEVLVVGVPDKDVGEIIKAIIVPTDDSSQITEEDIIKWCKGKMAGYKRPRLVEFRNDFPRNNVGKVLRRVVVEEERKKALKTQAHK